MFATTSKFFWPVTLTLALLMAATRGHHFATLTHLPDASWAVFLLAGFLLRPAWALGGLLALAALADWQAINQFAVNDFCVSAAYGFLIPAYAALWFAGRLYAARYRAEWCTLPVMAGFVVAGTALCEALSSGSFYLLSGRFADVSLVGFGHSVTHYLVADLLVVVAYLAVAGLVGLVVSMSRRTQPQLDFGH